MVELQDSHQLLCNPTIEVYESLLPERKEWLHQGEKMVKIGSGSIGTPHRAQVSALEWFTIVHSYFANGRPHSPATNNGYGELFHPASGHNLCPTAWRMFLKSLVCLY